MFTNSLRALSVLAISVSAAMAEDIEYEAVWHQGQAATLITAPLSLSVFKDTGQDLAESGQRLIDVETTTRNGTRLYAGLWTEGTGTNLFVGPVGAIEFGNDRRAKVEQGLRLEDFEVLRTNTGGRRYIGVWRNGTGEEVLTGPMEQAAFFARGEQLTGDGLRLVDVEVEMVSDTLLYHGLFQTGTGSNLITTPKSLQAFAQTRDEMVADGLELIDVEHVKIGGQDRFVGVWASGPGESRFSKLRPFREFFRFTQSQQNDGKSTRDFELRQVPTPSNPSGPGNGGGGPTTADLPDLPPHFDLVGGNVLVIDFTLLDGEVQIDFPLDHLPDHLPLKDDTPLIPEAFCGLNIRLADAIFWQVPGDDAVDDFPFNAVPNVAALGDEAFLGGVEFSGPMGRCGDGQQPWRFGSPFIQGGFFEPLPNMRLVIQLRQGGEIRFTEHAPPEGEVLGAHELFEGDTREKLKQIAEFFEANFGIDNGYCSIDRYVKKVCEEEKNGEAPHGSCPVGDDFPSPC